MNSRRLLKPFFHSRQPITPRQIESWKTGLTRSPTSTFLFKEVSGGNTDPELEELGPGWIPE